MSTSPVYDIGSDPGRRHLAGIARFFDFPQEIMQAPDAELHLEKSASNRRLFADPQNKRWPCHSKAATVISAAYFADARQHLTEDESQAVELSLRKLAAHWGVNRMVDTVLRHYSKINTDVAELPDDAFAFVLKEGEQKIRELPLRNPVEVKKAADWFCHFLPNLRLQLGYKDRQKIASKIREKAHSFAVNLGDNEELIDRAAGYGVAEPNKLAQVILNRIAAADTAPVESREGMRKLAAAIKNSPMTLPNQEFMIELAHTIDCFDRDNGLLNKYAGEELPSPEDAVFSASLAQLQRLYKNACQLKTGTIWDRQDFGKIPLDHVAAAFGEPFARGVARGLKLDVDKMAKVASELPKYQAELLDDMLLEVGAQRLAIDWAAA